MAGGRCADVSEPAGQKPRRAYVLAGYLILLMAALMVLLIALWVGGMKAQAGTPASIGYPWWHGKISKESIFIVMSLVGGALGGSLHGIASLTAHVAQGDLDTRWTMWYVTNPVVGAALAIVFFFVLQAGLGGQAAPTRYDRPNPVRWTRSDRRMTRRWAKRSADCETG